MCGGGSDPSSEKEVLVTTEETKEIAKLMAGKFIERRDAKAVQVPSGKSKGAYFLHREGPQKNYEDRPLVPFDLASLVAHVEGQRSFGHYLVNPAGDTCRMFAFDIDLNKSSPYYPNGPEGECETINPREVWRGPTTQVKRDLAIQLKTMARGLGRRTKKLIGCQVIVTYSGNKGMHVIACLDPGTPAIEARDMAVMVFDSFDHTFEPFRGRNFWKHTVGFPSLDIEIFPKQEDINPEGYGNLMRLPLGVNVKSDRPAAFMRMDDELDKFAFDDPLTVLREGSFRDS